MSDLKYKVGDKVRIKSLDWYNENKNPDYGFAYLGNGICFYSHMSIYCGKTMTISEILGCCYRMVECVHDDWTDEMIEGLVEDENNHLLTETVVDTVRESNDRYRIVIDSRFDIEVDEGEYYIVRRKKEYPKTYEECAEIITELTGSDCNPKGCMGYMSVQLTALQKLFICRDAYWKIAGDEMELGKPWEPDYNNEKQLKYGLYETLKYSLMNPSQFVFPTEEMRDAFKKNFDPDIEFCKELL